MTHGVCLTALLSIYVAFRSPEVSHPYCRSRVVQTLIFLIQGHIKENSGISGQLKYTSPFGQLGDVHFQAPNKSKLHNFGKLMSVDASS